MEKPRHVDPFRGVSAVFIISVALMTLTKPALASNAEANPFNSCGLGPDYSALAESLVEREVVLLNLMGDQARYLEPLEKTKSRYMVYSAAWTAAEFSALCLGVNAILFSAVAPAALQAIMSQQGVSLNTNKGLLLRQSINSVIGTVSTTWAATYHDDFGDINAELPAALQEIQGEIDTQNLDKNYKRARAHLHEMIRIYSDADVGIDELEIQQHAQNVDTYGVRTFLAKNPPSQLLSIPNKNALRFDWHLAKLAIDPWKGKKETVDIRETAIQAHINLYQDEIKYLQGEVGRLLARCEEHMSKLASQEPRISPAAVVDAAEKIGESLQTGQTGQSGDSSSARAPAYANNLK